MKQSIKVENIKDFFIKDIENTNFVVSEDFFDDISNLYFLKKIILIQKKITINEKYGFDLMMYLNIKLLNKGIEPLFRNYKILIKNIGCNANCPICIDWKNKTNLVKQKKLLNIVIDEILSEKIPIKKLKILGGEPLLIFDEIVSISKIAKQNNIGFEFPTNCSLLTKKKLDILIENDVFLTFSIDFPDKRHDKFRQIKSFEKIVQFTKYLTSLGIKIQRNSVVGKFNINYIEGFKTLYEIAKPTIHNFILIEENSCEDNKKQFLTKNEIEKLILFISEIKKNGGINILTNGFDKNIKRGICYIPYIMKSFIITKTGYHQTPCYTHKKIKNIRKFLIKSLNGKCNLNCDMYYLNDGYSTF